MSDTSAVVAQAIEESVNAFVRGVHCANPAHPDVEIPDNVVKWLQDHDDVRKSFEERLGSRPERWERDRPQVCRAAFTAESLAALHAYSKNDGKAVNSDDVIEALTHISTICEVGVGVRYAYCPWFPWPRSGDG